jgi:ribosomal protein S6
MLSPRFLPKPLPNNSLTFDPRIARTAGQQILSSRGVIRGITNWGPFLLPKPTTKHQSQHHTGHYFVMRFDASASTQQSVRRSLGLDPRMIRFSVVKIGDRLGGREARARQGAMENIQGQTYAEWNTQKDNAAMMSFNNKHAQRGAKGPY